MDEPERRLGYEARCLDRIAHLRALRDVYIDLARALRRDEPDLAIGRRRRSRKLGWVAVHGVGAFGSVAGMAGDRRILAQSGLVQRDRGGVWRSHGLGVVRRQCPVRRAVVCRWPETNYASAQPRFRTQSFVNTKNAQ